MLQLYNPGQRFLSVSVTGGDCDLNCAHCQSVFLKHMENTSSPDKLMEAARKLDAEGGIGILVSGGCDSEGKVPLAPYFDTLAAIKGETGLVLNVHTGLADESTILALKSAGVDVISVDIAGSETTAHNVYGLDVGPWDYDALLARLVDAGVNYVPHVTIGLDGGGPSGEKEAIDMISGYSPRLAVFNGLMRTPGLDGSVGVDPEYFHTVLGYAVGVLSDDRGIKIGIGCMRPRDMELPVEYFKDGWIDTLAMASKSLRKILEEAGIPYLEKDGCCALASLD